MQARFWKARSRLYRRRFLQIGTDYSGFFNFYDTPDISLDFCDVSELLHYFCRFQRNFVECHVRKQIVADLR